MSILQQMPMKSSGNQLLMRTSVNDQCTGRLNNRCSLWIAFKECFAVYTKILNNMVKGDILVN